MARRELERDREIIDLSSDSEDHDDLDNEVGLDAQFALDFPDDQELDDLFEGLPDMVGMEDHDFFDLNAIPDIDMSPSEEHNFDNMNPARYAHAEAMDGHARLFTAEECLQMVLDVLPDISVEHALQTIKENTQNSTRTLPQCEQLVAQFIDGGEYRKEADEANNKKRKRDADESLSEYEKDERDPEIRGYEADA